MFFYGPAKFNAKNTAMADFAGFLEAAKTPTEVIVIDHLEKPSEN